MAEKRFTGINDNDCVFQGVVSADPIFQSVGNGKDVAWITLSSWTGVQLPDGKYEEQEVRVPILVDDPRKVEVVRNHIKKGRQLQIKAYYKAWEVNGVACHAFIALKTVLGAKPYADKDNDTSQSSGAMIPPSAN